MSRRAIVVPCVAALAVLSGAGRVAGAQQFWISATGAQSSHRLLPSPRGPGAGGAWPLNDQIAVRAGFHHFTDRQTRVGSTCVGLVPDPAECEHERIDDRSALGGFSLELAATVARRGRVSLALVPSLSVVSVRSESRGERTGRTLDASSVMMGVGGAAELSFVPHARAPLALHLGAHYGMVDGSEMAIVDGYSPFTDEIRLTRVELRLSVWNPRRAARPAEPR